MLSELLLTAFFEELSCRLWCVRTYPLLVPARQLLAPPPRVATPRQSHGPGADSSVDLRTIVGTSSTSRAPCDAAAAASAATA